MKDFFILVSAFSRAWLKLIERMVLGFVVVFVLAADEMKACYLQQQS